jgi:hypothetical protein
MISVIAPAPRVVYHRTLLVTGQREPPDTATALPDDEELTELEDCRLLDDELADVDAVDELDAWLDDDAVPGTVAALTAPSTPTPANAPIAAPNVSRSSKRNASSRERTLSLAVCVDCMSTSVRVAAKASLGAI